MKNLILYFALGMTCIFGVGAAAIAESPLKITATLSSYGDIAKSIGGELVDVRTIASPKFNPHFIEPKPSDVLKVKNADLFIHSGLDLEVWRGALVDAAGRSAIRQSGERQLDLSTRVQLLEVPNRPISRAEGDIHLYGNPHYWLDPRNGKSIASQIADKLSTLDPKHRDEYQRNLVNFTSKIDERIIAWTQKLAPFNGQELIGYHNEWAYLMNFSGLTMKHFLEPKPGIPPSPQHIEFVVKYANEKGIRAIIQATFNSAEAANSVADRTKSKVLTLCQNVGESKEVPDYISLLDHNISKIVEALTNG